jgi:phosphatidate cytidylyltransferase
VLKTRAITAIFFGLTVIYSVLYASTELALGLLLLALAICAFEYIRLAKIERFHSTLLTILLSISAFFVLKSPSNYYFLTVLGFFWWMGNIFLVSQYPKFINVWFHPIYLRYLYALLLFIPSLVSIILIYNSYGQFALLSLFLILWTADSGAYFVGSKMGKRKLAPRVSPGKSIEGLLGGIFSVVLLSIILLMTDLLPFQSFLFVFVSAMTGIISVFGDLFESIIKREASAKDSSNLLPGHGGFLDRLDSLFAAAPIYYLGLTLL